MEEHLIDRCNSAIIELDGVQRNFFYRGDTLDAHIYREVISGLAYEVPKLSAEDLVIDIGAHIGSFCLFAYSKGSRNIYGFEVDADNHLIAGYNTLGLDGVKVSHVAVWRSDLEDTQYLYFTGYSDMGGFSNTGGGNVVFDNGERIKVSTIGLDTIIGDSQVKVLKLDCETSEWPILYSSSKLNQIDMIVGEYHEMGGDFDSHTVPEAARVRGMDRYTINDLEAYLGEYGFRTKHKRSGNTNIGYFSARRV